MLEDDKKEFDPSESEDFLRAINDALDLPDDFSDEKVDIESDDSLLIEIPDEETLKNEPPMDELSDNELDEYDAAIAQNLADLFEEVAASDKIGNEQTPNDENAGDEVVTVAENVGGSENEEKIENNDFITVAIEDAFPEEDHSGEEDIIDDINAALALQVNEINAVQTVRKSSKKWLLTLIPLVGIGFLFTKFREGMPKWLMGVRIAVFSIFAVFVIGVFASGGKLVYNIAGAYIRWRMAGTETTPTPPPNTTNGNTNDPITNQPISNPNNDETDSPVQLQPNPPREEDHIVNILLLGEEKIGSEHGRGRTDLIMIATLDTEQRSIKLTSIMRDILVAIPGHTDDRINSVYSKGGIDLLREVIALNFEIVPDGYMLVDFESFEQIINNLDGVTIELSKTEADYLNTTNYISKPEYRNVVQGMNKMNGNQALGYCRIRHVPTKDNVHSDFGRTSRQRVVLNAIFEKIKTKNLFQLALIADSCLPLVETDLSASQISDYMEKAVESKISSFVQMRVPINGTFTDATYNGITDLIQINFPENIKALHEFIFGDYKGQ